jgi:hypothetical protein
MRLVLPWAVVGEESELLGFDSTFPGQSTLFRHEPVQGGVMMPMVIIISHH